MLCLSESLALINSNHYWSINSLFRINMCWISTITKNALSVQSNLATLELARTLSKSGSTTQIRISVQWLRGVQLPDTFVGVISIRLIFKPIITDHIIHWTKRWCKLVFLRLVSLLWEQSKTDQLEIVCWSINPDQVKSFQNEICIRLKLWLSISSAKDKVYFNHLPAKTQWIFASWWLLGYPR